MIINSFKSVFFSYSHFFVVRIPGPLLNYSKFTRVTLFQKLVLFWVSNALEIHRPS